MKIWLVLDLLGDLKEPSEFKCMENSLLQSYFFFFFFPEGDCFYNVTVFECRLDQLFHIAFP